MEERDAVGSRDGPAVRLRKTKRENDHSSTDYIHRRMMPAIKAISDGRQLDDFASVPSDSGREFKIRDALIEGEREFPEPFDDDHWKVVLVAFAQLKLVPLSRRKDECCTRLLRAMGPA